MSPLWLHHLSDASQEWLPVLGAGWIILQGGVFLYKNVIKPLYINWKKPKA